MAGQQDSLNRAYAKIAALKESVPSDRAVKASLVEVFHKALQHLESLGYDVEEFKIPEKSMYRPMGADDEFIDYVFFITQVKSVLTYFNLQNTTSNIPPPQIDYGGPRKQS